MSSATPVSTAQRHAAPIPFAPTVGEALCRARCGAAADNDAYAAIDAQRLRTEQLLRAAHDDGCAIGERWGYHQGVHWGFVCGVCAGALSVGALWVLWAPLQGMLAQWGLA